jgi:hypothetical protein
LSLKRYREQTAATVLAALANACQRAGTVAFSSDHDYAYALRGKTIGDGEVWRACASVLRESGMFDPPLESHHGALKHVGKYSR